MTLAAGTLNRQIELQVQTGGVDELNQPINVWTTTATVWANVKGDTGMGAVRAAQEGVAVAPTRYSFRVRYMPAGVTEGMRVLFTGQVYDIIKVKHDHDRREWTDIVGEVGGNHG